MPPVQTLVVPFRSCRRRPNRTAPRLPAQMLPLLLPAWTCRVHNRPRPQRKPHQSAPPPSRLPGTVSCYPKTTVAVVPPSRPWISKIRTRIKVPVITVPSRWIPNPLMPEFESLPIPKPLSFMNPVLTKNNLSPRSPTSWSHLSPIPIFPTPLWHPAGIPLPPNAPQFRRWPVAVPWTNAVLSLSPSHHSIFTWSFSNMKGSLLSIIYNW